MAHHASNTRVELEPSFVLHTRPFRDSSLLVDLFSLRYGRIGAIARGARGPKSKSRGLLLPFIPILASWSGKGELVTLGKIEAYGSGYTLTGVNLLSGLYLNELLVRLLHKHDSHPDIYRVYQYTLDLLQQSQYMQSALRIFEKRLLAALGYGLQLKYTANRKPIRAEEYYRYEHEHGFIKSNQSEGFSGKSLLALHQERLHDANMLKDCKRLMRQIIARLLGDKPLKSRELFI